MPKQRSRRPTEGYRYIRRDRIRPFADQPRKYFNQRRLRNLAASIKTIGQIKPVLVRKIRGRGNKHTHELVDGQRRWHACEMIGQLNMKAVVIHVASINDQFLKSAVANMGQEPPTKFEVANSLARIMKEQNLSVSEVANAFAKSAVWAYQHLSLLDLCPEVLAMMGPEIPRKKRLGFQTAILLSRFPKTDQLKLARKTRSLDLRLARHEVNKVAKSKGMTIWGSKSKTPSDHYKALVRFLRTMESEISIILDWSPDTFASIFANRPAEARGYTKTQLEGLLRKLAMLHQAVTEQPARETLRRAVHGS